MKFESKIKSYTLEAVDNIFTALESYTDALRGKGRLFLFIDQSLLRPYETEFKRLIAAHPYLVIEAKEEHKEYIFLGQYFDFLIQNGFNRNDVLVTFGGGILQDISGFIASTLYRGIKWVYIPTTLLAQVDSCIGSKTSINFGKSKNLIGTFYPPDLILVDIHFTKSLRLCDVNSGLGEIIKFHLLSNSTTHAQLCKWLEFSGDLRQNPAFKEIILSTLAVKKSYFDQDEFDTGIRNLLNYGHCFGHALESASNFSITHGEAVMIGMGVANYVSRQRGLMKESTFNDFESLLRRYYPKFNWKSIETSQVVEYMKRDKKRVSQQLTMILGADVGQFGKHDDVTEEEVIKATQQYISEYPKNA